VHAPAELSAALPNDRSAVPAATLDTLLQQDAALPCTPILTTTPQLRNRPGSMPNGHPWVHSPTYDIDTVLPRVQRAFMYHSMKEEDDGIALC
jgi:hypothetical protein